MKVRLSRPVKIAIELAVLVLLVFLFVKVLDVRQVRKYIELITPQVIVGILGFQLAILSIQSLQWALILREAGIYRGIWWTFWSRVSGFALTYLTPSMYFGGEPVRASLYKDGRMSYQKVYATIALDKYIELAGKIPCIVAGFSLLVYFAHTGTALIFVAGSIVIVFVGLFVFLIVKLFGSRTFIITFFRRILRPLSRLNPNVAEKVLRALEEFGTHVHDLIGRRKIFYLAMIASFIVAVIEVLQTWYILFVLGHPSLPNSLVIFSTVVVQGLIGLLPGNIGGMEGTHLFIFNLLQIGSNPSLVYTIILRIGQMAMVLLGLLNIFAWRVDRVKVRGADRNRTDA
ncbi:MAG TPA: flippase-like domain-containing protein [Spirochaetia bacterium]|nr:flippase-like domain-containing protein [Spirochaetia bacterium]